MTNLTKYIRFGLPVILWAFVIFAFSSQPTGSASTIDWQDFAVKKLAHMVEYAIFTALSFRAFWNVGIHKTNAIIYAVLLSFIYGASDEIHQAFTPGREPAVRDVVFDTIGASLAGYTLWRLLPKAPKPLKQLAANFQLI